MTKAEIANLLMDRTGLARNESHEAVEIFLAAVKSSLKRGQKVSLVGFGTFAIKSKNARRGRNPRTGEQIHIPEKHVVIFKPGKSFREMVNGGELPEGAADSAEDAED
jgi:nucleoid DNA-binding protein